VKKNWATIVTLFTVLAIILVLYFIFNNNSDTKYQWYESYSVNSDQPYGTMHIKKMLESYRPDGKFTLNEKKSLEDVLNTVNKYKTDYVFIGQSIHLNDRDQDALLNFISEGNDAFISSLNFPDIAYKVYTSGCQNGLFYSSNRDSVVVLNFYHDTLSSSKGYSYAYRVGTDDEYYYWQALNQKAFCDTTAAIAPLGYFAPDHVNFLRFKYGKGNLYLHSNPLVFTNYFMLQPDKVEYAGLVFSHLKGRNMILDEYSKIPFYGNNNAYDSPLYYILQQPSLKYAWWMLLGGVFLYAVFAAKRTQRVIPVLETKSNTSLEYVQLISSLHYQNANHLDMARKKMRYFLFFIRSKYGIQTQHFTDDQMEKLAEKSKVNIAQVKRIFECYHALDHQLYSNLQHRLEDLYNSIEIFYQNCK
jgi:hypothetical protein